MHDAPHAPWALRGEIVLGVARRPRSAAGAAALSLPPELAALPGRVVVAAARYTASPIGPFVEIVVGVPARLGLRPGRCDVVVAVSDPAAKVGLRCNWGYPADVGTLTWEVDGDERVARWDERGLELRWLPSGPPLPFLVPVRAVQGRGDGPVIVPRRASGLARLGRVSVVVPDDDPLAELAGPHPGVVVSSMRLTLQPARRPMGLLSSFRAPLRAAEPGLSYEAPRSQPASRRALNVGRPGTPTPFW